MKKKNLVYLFVAILLVLVSCFVLLYENGVFKGTGNAGPDSKTFSIKDSSKVVKIFLADMHGNKVLLSRTPKGWMVDDTIPALKDNIDILLSTLLNLTVRQSVPKTALSNVNAMLAAGSVKVEVYEKAPKFTIFGIKIAEKERLTKTYYMGPATQDNMANFALLEGMDEPYIVYIPGFRGFVTPRFSQFSLDWISHRVFETKITRIKSVEFQDIENPSESFKVIKTGARFFDLYNYKNEKVMDYDTSKLIDMLSEFRNKNFESLVIGMSVGKKDSILNNNLFKIITLTDIEGEKTQLKLYKMINEDGPYFDEMDMVDKITASYSRDRFYGVINNNTKNFYKMQFFHFDRQVQPLSYFVTKQH